MGLIQDFHDHTKYCRRKATFSPNQSRYSLKGSVSFANTNQTKLELPEIKKPVMSRYLKYENDGNFNTKWQNLAKVILDNSDKKGFEQLCNTFR